MLLLNQITAAPVDRAERRALTLAAQKGDETAFLALLADLLPNLRAGLRRFQGAAGSPEDAEAVALLAFTEAIHDYDPKRDPEGIGVVRLLSERVVSALADAASQAHSGVTIPPRTASRFWAILKAADGNAEVAAAAAPGYGMASSTFREIHGVLFNTSTLAEAEWLSDSGHMAYESVEDRALASQALGALDGEELAVTRRAYGFATHRPESDGEIAGALGISRSGVQRKRAAALDTMREALCVS